MYLRRNGGNSVGRNLVCRDTMDSPIKNSKARIQDRTKYGQNFKYTICPGDIAGEHRVCLSALDALP